MLDGIFLHGTEMVDVDQFCAMKKKSRRALDDFTLDDFTLDERSMVARPERSTTCSLASVVFCLDQKL